MKFDIDSASLKKCVERVSAVCVKNAPLQQMRTVYIKADASANIVLFSAGSLDSAAKVICRDCVVTEYGNAAADMESISRFFNISGIVTVTADSEIGEPIGEDYMMGYYAQRNELYSKED